MIIGIFSLGTNSCFLYLIRLGLFSPSWAESLIFGLMARNKPRRTFFKALLHTIWPTGHNVCGAIVST